MLTLFSFFIFDFLFGFSYFIYLYESLGSQTHESQTRWPNSALACITSWKCIDRHIQVTVCMLMVCD